MRARPPAPAPHIAATVELIADLVAARTGFRTDLDFGRLTDRRRELAHIADPTDAREILGWWSRTPLADGLAETVRRLHRRWADAG